MRLEFGGPTGFEREYRGVDESVHVSDPDRYEKRRCGKLIRLTTPSGAAAVALLPTMRLGVPNPNRTMKRLSYLGTYSSSKQLPFPAKSGIQAVSMNDLWFFAGTVFSLIYGSCIQLICSRLDAIDSPSSSRWIWAQPRQLRRYWNLAPNHQWSRALVAGSWIAMAGTVFFFALATKLRFFTFPGR